ncbi:TolC family protein [Mangrovimonas aestuarii]|uniref:TolC family protein n=1 Tax=Mangrovimonas aestuarii TaxID=3018443 RepID=UPI0023783051|nr:TolC family protein [Mangrovimonas aestuarii]
MKKKLLICFVLYFNYGFSQDIGNVLTLEEYIGFVKNYHPIVKQARLLVNTAEADLLRARGAFDPKLEVNHDVKDFDDTNYYDKFKATFKVPTWYGVTLKANLEDNQGYYLNPEAKTPDDGLYSAGISLSLAKGLLMNDRMATLKQAKYFTREAKAKQELLVNDILYDALEAYFNWFRNYQKQNVQQAYVDNAAFRLNNVKKSFVAGDKPAIDTLEASINLKSRKLDFEKANIALLKSQLELSNYLWIEDNIPLELKEDVIPELTVNNSIDRVLGTSILNLDSLDLKSHPKILALQYKSQRLKLEKRLKANNLLPRIDLEYNFISSDYKYINSFNTENYKGLLRIEFPLFLRKERGDLKLAKLKIQDLEFDLSTTQVTLRNKVDAILGELDAYQNQIDILDELIEDYEQFVASEERRFFLGDGSVFLINYREVKLIESQIKFLDTQYELLTSKSNLLRVLAGLTNL